MNDQWSGNTLLSAVRANSAAPSRSSTQRAIRRVSGGRLGSPVRGPRSRGRPGSEKSPRATRYAVVVDAERQLRQRAGRRAEHRAGAVEHVERRLVARAQQQRRPRPGRARPGSRRGCTASSRRRCRRRSSPRGPARGSKSWSGRVRMSSVGASAASVWPSGQTVSTPSTARSSALHRRAVLASRRRIAAAGNGVVLEVLPGPGPERADREQQRGAERARTRRRRAARAAAGGGRSPLAPLEVGGEGRRRSSSVDAERRRGPRRPRRVGHEVLGPDDDADADAARGHAPAARPRAAAGRPASRRRRAPMARQRC